MEAAGSKDKRLRAKETQAFLANARKRDSLAALAPKLAEALRAHYRTPASDAVLAEYDAIQKG